MKQSYRDRRVTKGKQMKARLTPTANTNTWASFPVSTAHGQYHLNSHRLGRTALNAYYLQHAWPLSWVNPLSAYSFL